jgi:hypothetical protein
MERGELEGSSRRPREEDGPWQSRRLANEEELEQRGREGEELARSCRLREEYVNCSKGGRRRRRRNDAASSLRPDRAFV